MTWCEVLDLPGGHRAIVCRGGKRPKMERCDECNEPRASQLCDWKMPGGGTCDKKLCPSCTTIPAHGKDLCKEHAALWKARVERARAPDP